MTEELIRATKAIFSEKNVEASACIRFSTNHLDIFLSGESPHEQISIYCINKLMLKSGANRVSVDTYKFVGPRLGLYHITYDPRDGPVLNHFISKLDISIKYLSKNTALFSIFGSADTQFSNIDKRDYKEKVPISWSFSVEFPYEFKC